MGLGCAANDCTDIGGECHKCESNSKYAQDFFVWDVSHDFIRLTLPLSGAPFRASA